MLTVKKVRYHKDITSLQINPQIRHNSHQNPPRFDKLVLKFIGKRKRIQTGKSPLKKKKYVKEIALLETRFIITL